MNIEKIQETGLRIAHKDYTSSYNDLLQKFGKDLMYVSRLKTLVAFVYTSINNIAADLTSDIHDEKHLPYSLRESCKVIHSEPASTKFSVKL